jgi:GntR family transcriptional regulator
MPIDPESPVPLYHQIAESIRTDVEAGRLRKGDALAPMREAAERWGVNMHTVRHAYAALAREGLLEANRGPKGTRVARDARHPTSQPDATPEPLTAFLDGVMTEAKRVYGLDGAALSRAISTRSSDPRPEVFVVECSEWQAQSHAAELAELYDVRATPWELQQGEPPDGTVVATYFHYNDVRRQWPRRLAGVRFVSIYPAPDLFERFRALPAVTICEMEYDTAEAVAADFGALFEAGAIEVNTTVAENPDEAARARSDADPPYLFAPRAWARLSPEARNDPALHELRYVLDRKELEAIAAQERWWPAQKPETDETERTG